MNAKAVASTDQDAWASSLNVIATDRTGETDNERIKDITVLPPPEHLIRFFPIHGTPVEKMISATRRSIHNIMAGKDDRLLVVIERPHAVLLVSFHDELFSDHAWCSLNSTV